MVISPARVPVHAYLVDNPAVSAMELALALMVMERAPVFEGQAGVPWIPRAVNRGLFSGRLVIRPVE